MGVLSGTEFSAFRAAAAVVMLAAMRILIAEDDPVSRELLRHALEGHGHQVTAAADGRAALAAFQAAPADMVITDWMMPEMDGPRFAATSAS